MKTIKIKNRDGLIRTGSILAEHEDSKRRHWVTVLCANDDVETLPADNIVHIDLGKLDWPQMPKINNSVWTCPEWPGDL